MWLFFQCYSDLLLPHDDEAIPKGMDKIGLYQPTRKHNLQMVQQILGSTDLH